MNEKVKVSHAVAEQIEKGIDLFETRENFIHAHARNFGCWGGDSEVLNDISTFEMALILINGYEIEKTPEEKLLELHSIQIKNKNNWNGNSREYFFCDGYLFGIKKTLDILGIKIKGIND